MPDDIDWNRRTFLKSVAVSAAGSTAVALAPTVAANTAVAAGPKPKSLRDDPAGKLKTKRVVLVIMGGGVRTRDVFEPRLNPRHPDCPTINTIAAAGLMTRTVKTRDIGPYGGALNILTGVDQKPLKSELRAEDPTVFELLRRYRRLPGHQVWLSAAGSEWHSQLSFSRHPAYGVRFGANYIAGDGVFTSELADVTNQFGEPAPVTAADKALVEQIQAKVDPTVARATLGLRGSGTPQDVRERVRRYVLDELSGQVRKIESPGLRDIMAIHYATNLLAVFKPTLLTIALVYASLGKDNRDRYLQVLRKNDAELARLWATIQGDPELADSTTLMIVPDYGRNERENPRGGFDHDDKSKTHLEVSLTAWGPDFKKAAGEVRTELDINDVAPTLLQCLGVPWRPTPGKPAGKVATELFA